MKAVVLLSPGRPGREGRERRAALDSRAVELALTLTLSGHVVGLTAGAQPDKSLSGYAGMGLATVEWVEVEPGHDIVGPLADIVQLHAPDLLLAGAVAEGDVASGMLPHAIAATLGWPILTEIAALEIERTGMIATQRLGRGMVRRLRAPFPAVVTVGMAAPAPRQVAYAKARRMAVTQRAPSVLSPALMSAPEPLRHTAPPRPAIASLADLSAGIASVSTAGTSAVPPAEAAQAIFAALASKGLLAATNTE